MNKATNSALMRKKNEKIILSLINKQPISRAEIAKITGLTKAAVTIIVDELKSKNIITEKQCQTDMVGRNPIMLYLNNAAFYIIGINITRFNVFIGISDLSGNVICEDKIKIGSPKKTLIKINNILDNLIKNAKISKSDIFRLAVITPGPVDVEKGIILNPPNFLNWHNFPILSELSRLTGFHVVFANISSATAIAEKYFGSGKNTDNFLVLRVDEGIGSGIVTGDKLFEGPCEFGHISINYDGELCACGNRGCLEKYASIPSILKNTQFTTWREVVDKDCTEIITKEAEYLSCGIISANNIFSFEKIILCGEINYKTEKLIELLSKKISNKILLNKSIEVSKGLVTNESLIAASIGIHDLF